MKIRTKQLNYLWEVSRGQRRRILLTCLTGIVGVVVSLAFIYTSKLVIDIATGSAAGSLSLMAAITVALVLVQLACSAVDTWLSTRMQVESGNAMRHRLFDRLIRSRWNELERFHTGDVVNRVEQDTTNIITLLTSTIPSAIVTLIQLVAAFAFFFVLDKVLPLIVVAIIPLFVLGSRFYMRRMRRYTQEIRRSDSDIQAVIQEGLQHRTVIKTLEQGERHLDKLDDLQEALRTQVFDRTRFSLSARMLAGLAFSGGYLTAFLWGAVRLSTDSITFGTMTAFLQLVGRLQRPALDLSRLLPSLVNALTAVDRLLELEELPAETSGDTCLFPATPIIYIDNVSFGYSADATPVLSRLTARFPAGSRTAVLGETGAGKTTLIRLLLALIVPDEGSITLTDTQTGAVMPASPQTRANFVYVPQGNTLFSGTIHDNLLMGKSDATDDEMRAALHTACADFVLDMPLGIDTILSEQGGGLSEGQAQRIAIARALLRPGHILLFDEATSALDPATERQLIDNLQQAYAGKTFIFITHHVAVAEACEQTIYLD
ncbi:MAG: ABC transporter ATP-binding protein/permease [Prevotellaceae bacterium]|jgi:ABC-type bacteriocin/lantibiotic exporter with double-glycine peptidase domain|nr:ABC transporter ATP-binding protein/permease [Prevotellaceae bacterium]